MILLNHPSRLTLCLTSAGGETTDRTHSSENDEFRGRKTDAAAGHDDDKDGEHLARRTPCCGAAVSRRMTV